MTQTVPRKKKKPSLVLVMVRVILVLFIVVLALFLGAGWYFSSEIRSGALEPATAGPESYDWSVVDAAAAVTLESSAGTDQAGQAGASGIMWEGGYGQSGELLSSTESGGSVVDIRSILAESPTPPTDTDVKVDTYFWRGDPMSAHGLAFETVYYTSDIGSFPAWYIPPARQNNPNADTWAIVVHGKGGTLEESLRVVPMLHERGHPVMVISYRNDVSGVRDPSGYYTYGQTDWADLAGAVLYARDQGADDHILVGYSYGGSIIASYLTQSPLRNFTKASILDSPVLSFEDTVDYRATLTDVPIFGFEVPQLVTNLAKNIAEWRFGIDWEATNYLTQTAQIHTPLLIFHGTADTSVPLYTSRVMELNRPDITTLVVTDAGHTRSWNVDSEFFETTVNEFLDELG
jgi:pimeloyl-ACP methyl ester carboxylesterase